MIWDAGRRRKNEEEKEVLEGLACIEADMRLSVHMSVQPKGKNYAAIEPSHGLRVAISSSHSIVVQAKAWL